MKRVLFLCGRFSPKPSANSICVQNIINTLPKDQFEVVVVAYNDGYYSPDGFDVYKFKRGLIQSLLYYCENQQRRLYKIITNALCFIQRIKQLLCVPIWPWFDPITSYRELKLVRKVIRSRKIDLIVAVHTPVSSLYVADKIKKENPNIKYIAYFLDSLSGGYVPKKIPYAWYDNKCRILEKQLIKRADRIVFMNSSKEYHLDLYKDSEFEDRIVFLDVPLLIERECDSTNANEHVSLVYVGSLASSMRSPQHILDVFSYIKDPAWELIFVGDSSCKVVNEYANQDRRIKVIGKCSHGEALRYEKEATILVNLGNNNPNMVPSKVFEYMSWCKKIVSTYSFDGDTSIAYLKRYPLRLLINERDSAEKQAVALFEFVNKEMQSVSYADIKKEFHSNTPEAFIELI